MVIRICLQKYMCLFFLINDAIVVNIGNYIARKKLDLTISTYHIINNFAKKNNITKVNLLFISQIS